MSACTRNYQSHATTHTQDATLQLCKLSQNHYELHYNTRTAPHRQAIQTTLWLTASCGATMQQHCVTPATHVMVFLAQDGLSAPMEAAHGKLLHNNCGQEKTLCHASLTTQVNPVGILPSSTHRCWLPPAQCPGECLHSWTGPCPAPAAHHTCDQLAIMAAQTPQWLQHTSHRVG